MVRTFRLLNLRRLRRQPVRVLMTVLAVAAGVSLTVSVLVVTSSLERSLRRFGAAVSGPADLRIVGATSRAGVTPDLRARVAATPGVAAAVPIVQAVTVTESTPPHRPAAVWTLALGVDCRVEALLGPLGCDPAAIAAASD